MPDDDALLLGIDDAVELAQEPLARVDDDDVEVQHVAECRQHLLGFVFAQQPVIDENAGELVADRARHERRRNGRVDAARKRADDVVAADLRRIAAIARSTNESISQSSASPATLCRKLRRIVVPCSVCTTSG